MTERTQQITRVVNGLFLVAAIFWVVVALAIIFGLCAHRGPSEPLQTY